MGKACSAPTADDVDTAQQRIEIAMNKAAQLFADLGGIDDLAVKIRKLTLCGAKLLVNMRDIEPTERG